jgi:hypothetical protein
MSASAFNSRIALSNRRLATKIYSSPEEEADFIPPVDRVEQQDGFFDSNRRVRLGRSRDQDGKSNIWSIEPKMEVIEEEGDGAKTNLFVGGAAIGAALLALPAFVALSKFFPDPADF